MANIGRGFWTKYLPKNVKEKIRKVWEFKPEDPNRGWQVPPANAAPPPGAPAKGYRYPAPNTQPAAAVPTTDYPERVYDIGYFKRDTSRAPRDEMNYIAPGLRPGISDGKQEATALLGDKAPPDRPPESRGNKNPAVLRYDPSGLRSAMSATNEARDASIQRFMPDHNVRPSWVDDGVDLVQEAKEKGLPPPPGKMYQW